MKIWHQSMGSVRMNNVGDALNQHAQAVVEEGTEVIVHGLPGDIDYVVSLRSLKDGTAPAGSMSTIDVIGSPYLYHLTLSRVIDMARQAEAEGYDAFVIGSWTDPYLREIRSVVDIPVVSTAEANMVLASSFGSLQGHICLNATVEKVVRDRVREYGMSDRVASVSSFGPDVDEWMIQDAWNKPDEFIEQFTKLANDSISLGADVIVPSEGIITEFFYANGVTKIGVVPVLDTFGLAWKYAELLVNLRRKMNLTVSRGSQYRRASASQEARVRASLGLSEAFPVD